MLSSRDYNDLMLKSLRISSIKGTFSTAVFATRCIHLYKLSSRDYNGLMLKSLRISKTLTSF